MPVGEQAAGRSLGTIFYPARLTARIASGQLWHLIPRFLHGRGLSSHRDLPVCNHLLWRSRSCFGANLVAPGETFLPGFEAGEITTAGRAAMRSRAQAQKESRPARRIVEVLHPGGQFLTVAAWATRVPPGSIRPDAGSPAMVAAAAAKLRNTDPTLQVLAQTVPMGNAHIPRPAARTVQLHGLVPYWIDSKRLYRPVFGRLHTLRRAP